MIRATFGSTGREKNQVFEAEDIHTLRYLIDASTILTDWEKDCLKFGYFKEFEKSRRYHNQSYVIDNCMHFIWEVDDK